MPVTGLIHRCMKQLFSAYPAGFAGCALMLFRGSVVLALVAGLMTDSLRGDGPALVVGGLGAALTIGFYARICALLSIAAMCFLPIASAEPTLLLLATHIVDALALAMIGPGAFSLDAHLFGRSTINLPR